MNQEKMEITDGWLKIYDRYISLQDDWQRELFLQNLKPAQQDYLKLIVESKSVPLDYMDTLANNNQDFETHIENHEQALHFNSATENDLPEDIFYNGNFHEDLELEMRANGNYDHNISYPVTLDYYDPNLDKNLNIYADANDLTSVTNNSLINKIKRVVHNFKHFF